MKKLVKKPVQMTKKVVKRVPVLHRAAIKAKRVIIPGAYNIDPEVYNLSSHYPTIAQHMEQIESSKLFAKRPLISILLPVYNTPIDYLKECIDSVRYQSYDNWELCIADDASPNKEVVEVIKEYVDHDKRIKFIGRKKNGHISEASNSALSIAQGEFVGLLDHDDVLWPNALYEIVKTINENPKADFIYTDEDKIDGSGTLHSYPFLKPDWSPEFLESCNYITHFSCIRTKIIKQVDGFRVGYEGAQDWDLFIRIGEVTSNIIHVPKLLYSWRIHEASTASNTDAKPYVYEAQKKLLEDHVTRIKVDGEIETGIIIQHRTIKYDSDKDSLLTIVVLCSNLESTQKITSNIKEVAAGREYEIIYLCPNKELLDQEAEVKKLLPTVSSNFFLVDEKGYKDQLRLVAKESKGDHILCIEDTVDIVTKDWAKIAIGDMQLSSVGMVGPLLLHEDMQTIASAGVGLGYGPKGFLDMLRGASFDDPHYTRGLYIKSRRNVSALNGSMYYVKKKALEGVLENGSKIANCIELCIAVQRLGFRIVYSPYIRAKSSKPIEDFGIKFLLPETEEDPYLNRNFKKENSLMEVSP